LAGRPKIGWENIIKEAVRIMRVNNWTVCIQNGVDGRKQLGRPKLSNGEVVAPEEDDDEYEEEEEEDWSKWTYIRQR
jgi:hypothetical protein